MIRKIFSILLALLMIASSLYLGNLLLSEYLAFEPVIVFSWFSPATFIAPIPISFALIYHTGSLFYTEEVATRFCAKIIRYFMYATIIACMVSVMLVYFYTQLLEDKGYKPCPGVPSGYMPMMGTKYVTSLSLCKT
ncbi:Protein of unknown function [Vibrio xiamenensis]|uniref:DUF1240 domain-containing protein n=2 Tax=Vibrio xiamenensis TaxID=861298 RepID=A0A1G8A5G3_9VIBR|nr:Protein of unknown function [Vibrio xiamenensis]